MSNETLNATQNTELSLQRGKEFKWHEVVEKQLLSNAPLLVEVSDVDVKDDDVGTVRVGDNLFLRDVTVEHVQLTLAETYENESCDHETIVIPVTFGGKYKPCPFYPPTHTFASVEEIISVYPFVSDIIFPQETITIEGNEIPAWEILKVITLVQDNRSNQLLEIKIVKRQKHVLLPASLEARFLQWNDHFTLKDETILRKDKPRIYSLLELCEFWSSAVQPMTIEIYKNAIFPNEKSLVGSPVKINSKFPKIFRQKDRKPNDTLNEKSPVINDQAVNEDYWMIPEAWRLKKLILKPLHTVRCTNANTSAKLTLIGEQRIKVLELTKPERVSSLRSSDGTVEEDESPRSSRSLSETSVPLHHLDLMSLFGNKSRDNAIVGVVTSGLDSSSRQSNSMTCGSWVALHRTRRVRKLLIMSTDAQYFLVSAHYAGKFVRLPLSFDEAGEVPTESDDVYITRCTAYPVEKELDPCQDGHYVRFKNQSTMTISNNEVNVVHCTVSSERDGPQREVTYPLNLRGRFEKVDESPTEMTTHELFKRNFPICAKIENPDCSLGFDPLAKKQSFIVKKIISETTVIVEALRKYEDCVKPGGRISEIPSTRSSLFLREVPTKAEDAVGGILPYPRKKNFKGLEKLPCVEVLAGCDIVDLQEDYRSASVQSLLSPTAESNEIEEISMILEKQVKRPSYAVVNKFSKGKLLISTVAEENEENVDDLGKDRNSLPPTKEDAKSGLSSPDVFRRTTSDTSQDHEFARCVLSSFKTGIHGTNIGKLTSDFKPKPMPRKRLMTLPVLSPTSQCDTLPSFYKTETITAETNNNVPVTPEQSDSPSKSDQHSHSVDCIAFTSGEYASLQETAKKWSSQDISSPIVTVSGEENNHCDQGRKLSDSTHTEKDDYKEEEMAQDFEDTVKEEVYDYEDIEEENINDYEDIEEEKVNDYEDIAEENINNYEGIEKEKVQNYEDVKEEKEADDYEDAAEVLNCNLRPPIPPKPTKQLA